MNLDKLTYAEVEATLTGDLPEGFRHTRVRVRVSDNLDDLEWLGDALLAWQVHERCLHVGATGPAREGVEVALRPRWLPAPTARCRVVRVINETDCIGFVYGTLEQHPECGEEAFILERGEAGIVFSIIAFSRPGTWLTRVAGPVGYRIQDLYTRRYVAAMREIGTRNSNDGRRPIQVPADERRVIDMAVERPILIFDGDCGFCTTSVNFLRRYVKPECVISEWQRADLDSLGLTIEQCNEAVQWVGSPADRASGGAAIAAVFKTGRPLWRGVGRLIATPPMRRVTELGYRAIARNRYRLPGGTPACALPAAVAPNQHR